MITITGNDGGLLSIGKIDILDQTLTLALDTLFVLESGYYPFLNTSRMYKASNVRFRGSIFYQSNIVQDHALLPEHLKPKAAYGFYSVELSPSLFGDSSNTEVETAYLIANLDERTGAVSKSFYQICRYAQEFTDFKINGILLSQNKVYAQESPSLNLSEDLLGPNLGGEKFDDARFTDFLWGDDYTPTIKAYADLNPVEYLPFADKISGVLYGIGKFETWYVTSPTEIPTDHINNYRNLVINIQVSQINAQKLMTNTVTTPEYLDMLINIHKLKGIDTITILSETRAGVPIYMEYSISQDSLKRCLLSYSEAALKDYIYSEIFKDRVVLTEQIKPEQDLSKIQKDDRYAHADFSVNQILSTQQPQAGQTNTGSESEVPTAKVSQPLTNSDDGEYNPDVNVLALQHQQLSVDLENDRQREIEKIEKNNNS